ncbi:hypothetical protein JCM33774_42300 [Actinophytocola sp. KF-1]
MAGTATDTSPCQTSPVQDPPPSRRPARPARTPRRGTHHKDGHKPLTCENASPSTYVNPHPFPGATRHASLPVSTDRGTVVDLACGQPDRLWTTRWGRPGDRPHRHGYGAIGVPTDCTFCVPARVRNERAHDSALAGSALFAR